MMGKGQNIPGLRVNFFKPAIFFETRTSDPGLKTNCSLHLVKTCPKINFCLGRRKMLQGAKSGIWRRLELQHVWWPRNAAQKVHYEKAHCLVRWNHFASSLSCLLFPILEIMLGHPECLLYFIVNRNLQWMSHWNTCAWDI